MPIWEPPVLVPCSCDDALMCMTFDDVVKMNAYGEYVKNLHDRRNNY